MESTNEASKGQVEEEEENSESGEVNEETTTTEAKFAEDTRPHPPRWGKWPPRLFITFRILPCSFLSMSWTPILLMDFIVSKCIFHCKKMHKMAYTSQNLP